MRAACGFSPTARKRKPSVDRLISHQTTAVMTMTSRKPQLRLYRAPNRSGRIALGSVAGDFGFGLPGDAAHGPDESVHLPTLFRAVDTCVRLLDELGRSAADRRDRYRVARQVPVT